MHPRSCLSNSLLSLCLHKRIFFFCFYPPFKLQDKFSFLTFSFCSVDVICALIKQISIYLMEYVWCLMLLLIIGITNAEIFFVYFLCPLTLCSHISVFLVRFKTTDWISNQITTFSFRLIVSGIFCPKKTHYSKMWVTGIVW